MVAAIWSSASATIEPRNTSLLIALAWARVSVLSSSSRKRHAKPIQDSPAACSCVCVPYVVRLLPLRSEPLPLKPSPTSGSSTRYIATVSPQPSLSPSVGVLLMPPYQRSRPWPHSCAITVENAVFWQPPPAA